MLHQKNADEINVSEGGMMDIANIVSSHEEAIADLADIVSTLSDTTTVQRGENMVKFYVRKITNGDITIDDVPHLWKKRVEEELEKLEQ